MFSDISIAVIFSGLVRMRYSDMISVPVLSNLKAMVLKKSLLSITVVPFEFYQMILR